LGANNKKYRGVSIMGNKDVEEKFTLKYNNNLWLDNESRSGPGSKLAVNMSLLSLIEDFVKLNKIKSIIDCGCGDFNWMQKFNIDLVNYYIGIDIVNPLINNNNLKYSNNKIKFIKSDIITDDIPYGDMIICKDCLFHLSFDHALKALENIKKSNSKFFISTTFYDFNNIDIVTGNWRPINLEADPFLLGKPILLWKNIENKKIKYISKSIGVWSF